MVVKGYKIYVISCATQGVGGCWWPEKMYYFTKTDKIPPEWGWSHYRPGEGLPALNQYAHGAGGPYQDLASCLEEIRWHTEGGKLGKVWPSDQHLLPALDSWAEYEDEFQPVPCFRHGVPGTERS